jgi:dTDP-4-dehydrorhamnose 3,5-epimerase/CDP-3, 6-dideoxy-D-glycero-D-glycero-4-hexulose-5-epimerase
MNTPPAVTPHELLPGVWHLPVPQHRDERGVFTKVFSPSLLGPYASGVELRESYYTVSHRHVLRGMHFQAPPHDHFKLVHCVAGAALDVILDIRPGPGYGRFASVTLDAKTPSLLLIPPGLAHGFLALQDNTLMHYQTSTAHQPDADTGIHWASFGFAWPVVSPVVSSRDAGLPALAPFRSPFAERLA